MPPAFGEASSSRPTTRAVKIPTRLNSASHHHSQPAHQRRQHHFYTRNKSAMASEEAAFSSSSLASSSSGSYTPPEYQDEAAHTSTSAYPETSNFSSFSPSPSSSSESGSHFVSHSSSTRKMKSKAVDSPPSTPSNPMPVLPSRSSPLGPAMLSSHTYKSINLNGPDQDDPPRLITFTRSGQGFTWNEELFLPSYMIGRYTGRGRRKQYDGDLGEDDVEVAEIFVTDEEASRMMP